MEAINVKLESGLRTLIIDGCSFECDVHDLNAITVLWQFSQKYSRYSTLTEELLQECHDVLDAVLGPEAYAAIFKEAADMRAYYLVLQLVGLYQEEFQKQLPAIGDDSVKELTKVSGSLNQMVENIEKLEHLYAKHGLSPNKPAGKHRRKG